MKNIISRGNLYGKLTILVGVFILFPIIVLPFYPQDIKYLYAFVIPSAVLIIIGLIINCVPKKATDKILNWQAPMQKGSIPVLYVWFLAAVAGAFPFYISKQTDFVHSLFESVSGWSTTGLSVIDVTKTANIFLFYRSLMQYFGGLGFILIITLLVQGKQALNMYHAEGHTDHIKPNIKKTVKIIVFFYAGCLVAGVALYCIFGMNLFDSICHTMSALSTAGFTTKANSIGQYASVPIEVITIILMLVGSTNFAVLMLIISGKIKRAFKVTEVKFVGWLMLIFVPLIAISISTTYKTGFLRSLHDSLFAVVTTFSTTGYSTAQYDKWPAFAVGLLILLMVIGGGTGSTAGGIKLSRIYLLLKISFDNIKKKFAPSRNIKYSHYYKVQGKTPIDSAVISDTIGFVSCYIVIVIVGTLLLTLTEGCSLMDALFEFCSAFGTVGISNGLTANAKNITLLIEMVAMILGRLEIFIFFFGLKAMYVNIRNFLKYIQPKKQTLSK